MFKTIFSLIIILFCFSNLNAQKQHNIKLKIETGLHWMSKEDLSFFGLFFHLEPSVQTSKNTFIGLRFGAIENPQINENYKPPQFFIDNDIITQLSQMGSNTIFSFGPTFNYYFIEKQFRPYLGVGIGYYTLAVETVVSQRSPPLELLKVSVENQIGILLRGGLDIGRFIVGLEFNFIPKADIEIQTGQTIGTITKSHLGLSVGYSFGFGKDSK